MQTVGTGPAKQQCQERGRRGRRAERDNIEVWVELLMTEQHRDEATVTADTRAREIR